MNVNMATVCDKKTCCALSERLYDKDPVEQLGKLLWNGVWQYLSSSEDCRNVINLNKDLPWMLASCSYSGCMKTFSFLLHKYISKQFESGDNCGECSVVPLFTKHLINQRSECDFPLPDTWIHHCTHLAITPLHLACWRLDFQMIQTLLLLGADPKALAAERRNSSEKHDEGTVTSSTLELHKNDKKAEELNYLCVKKEEFDFHSGISPLNFVLLGVRSPPMYSLGLALRHDVVHDIKPDYQHRQKRIDDFLAMCNIPNCGICCNLLTLEDLKIEVPSHGMKDPKEELIEMCLELLLSAGVNPNERQSSYLKYAQSLDLIIQPPIHIFYASNNARSTQTSVNLRRYNLEINLPYVVIACQVLLSYKASLSQGFTSIFKWKPQHLDSFCVNYSVYAVNLVKILVQGGLFPDHLMTSNLYSNTSAISSPLYSFKIENNKVDGLETEDIEERMQLYMYNFIASVVNKQSPKELVCTVLQHCSVSTVTLFCKVARRIVEMSEFDHEYLSELIKNAIQDQLRSLTHLSMLVILNATGCNHSAIESLPLPNALKRHLFFGVF